jgi:hypothetical protein
LNRHPRIAEVYGVFDHLWGLWQQGSPGAAAPGSESMGQLANGAGTWSFAFIKT